jgi:predicted DNA-binding transcriptional regulator AlpA
VRRGAPFSLFEGKGPVDDVGHHHAHVRQQRRQGRRWIRHGAEERLEADALESEAPTPTPANDSTALYLRVPGYAKRVSLSERTIWSLISKGLPTIGAGRSRRVDVARADEWLRERRDHVDDALERQARAAAGRAAGRVRP